MNRESVTRAFWSYTIPAVAAMLISGLYVVIDGVFIGRAMGASGLSSINLAWPLNGVLIAIGLMIGMGAGAICSLSLGAGKIEEAKSYIIHALFLLIALGVPAGLLVVILGESFLSLQGAEVQLAELGYEYLELIGWASPIVFGSVALPFIVRNLGAPRLATIAMLVGAISNVILDYVFIIEWGMGLYGAALATVLGESLSVIVCLAFILGKSNSLRITACALNLSVSRSVSVLKAGFPSMIMYLYISLVVVVHNMLLMHYGNSVYVAAYAVAGYIMSIYYMFAEGVAAGMQPLISFYYGSGRIDKVRRVFKLGIVVGVGFGIIFTAALLMFTQVFVSFFSGCEETQLLDASVVAARLHLFAMYLDGFIILGACFFQSMGHVRKATIINVSNMLILFPFLAVMPIFFGLNGVWVALPISNIILSLIVIWMIILQLDKGKY
ncbi:MATE family efflux transporter [Pseudomonas fluorescens]|uniref:MATE family efflux transporter n=1 Tax=Pseudomonas fluorescens TaxID=294 RepID=UPI000CD04F1D|nr:MATE family efflux transporter [Pseudomonas fluorescens]PNY78789.1 multidrug efflux protein [Pseudomonas fluorescens]